MYTIDYFGRFHASVEGDGQLAASLREYFARLVATDCDADPDLRIREWESEPAPDTVLGDPDSYYGRDGTEFVIKDGRNFVAIDEDWTQIRADPRTSHSFVGYLIEFELRRRLAEEGYALIHASGVELDGRVILFPAWRHTGKTNTMISLIRDGGGYLSDDRVWIHESGSVRGYPLPVNMLPYNFDSFPELLNVSRTDRLRAHLADEIRDRIEKDRSILDKVVMFLNRYYVDVDIGQVVQLDELLPDSYFVDEAKVNDVVFLRTDTGRSGPRLADIDEYDALDEFVATSYYEWNERLREYVLAHDTLFPEGNKAAALSRLEEREREIVRDMLSTVNSHRLSVPREEEWTDRGITERIENQVRSLE